ncbi:MAG: diacylglycerol kinase [Burkholderiaceae bacterium]|nr:MAG: diacylglycerol kinase [Burkholderiaceae bacterium]
MSASERDAASHTGNSPPRRRYGLSRIGPAACHSLAGLRAGWLEPAFRQETVLAVLMVPAAFWLGRSWVEIALLAGSVLLVLIVELLNTGIEAAIDRIGPEWHDLSKRAKDLGSAAVLLGLLLCGGIWAAAIYERFIA